MAYEVARHHLCRIGRRTPHAGALLEQRQLWVSGLATRREEPACRIRNAPLAARHPYQHFALISRRRKSNVCPKPYGSASRSYKREVTGYSHALLVRSGSKAPYVRACYGHAYQRLDGR